MKIKLFSNTKFVEGAKLALITLLFISMLWLFVYYTEVKLGALGIVRISAAQEFPADKMWIFSGSANRSAADEETSPYIFPTSVTFRFNSGTYSVTKQKSTLVNVYRDMVLYVAEVLGPQYSAQEASYDEYVEFIKNGSYTLLSYDNDLSAYMLRLYCNRNAVGFYSGEPCEIKKILLAEDENGRLISYTVDSDSRVMRFVPLTDADATAYPINSAVISAYTNSKVIVPSTMSFESDFFSELQEHIAPDIVFLPEMQFYEVGISNPLSFITTVAAEDSLIKNNSILSILKSFGINTGLVRHYTDGDVIHFVESNASLEMSADGYIAYNGDDGGLPLSKLLGKESDEFSVADKLTAASVLMGSFGSDIIGGNGELIMSDVSYDAQRDVMKFEFIYSFDSVPFYGLDKAEIEIGRNSVLKAYIPTCSIYRNSIRTIALIAPEIAYNATFVSEGKYVSDYKPAYIVEKNGITANVGWLAVA